MVVSPAAVVKHTPPHGGHDSVVTGGVVVGGVVIVASELVVSGGELILVSGRGESYRGASLHKVHCKALSVYRLPEEMGIPCHLWCKGFAGTSQGSHLSCKSGRGRCNLRRQHWQDRCHQWCRWW